MTAVSMRSSQNCLLHKGQKTLERSDPTCRSLIPTSKTCTTTLLETQFAKFRNLPFDILIPRGDAVVKDPGLGKIVRQHTGPRASLVFCCQISMANGMSVTLAKKNRYKPFISSSELATMAIRHGTAVSCEKRSTSRIRSSAACRSKTSPLFCFPE